MKKILFLLSVCCTALSASAQFTSARLTAAGLTCAMCTKAIYTSLQKVQAVSSVNADIKNSSFVIEFKAGADVDPDMLKAAVEEAGFSVAKLTLSGSFDNLKIGKDEHIRLGARTFHFLNTSQTTLNGKQTITLVDRHYLTGNAFKKYASSSDMLCVRSGKTEKCCIKEGVAANSRIYHATI